VKAPIDLLKKSEYSNHLSQSGFLVAFIQELLGQPIIGDINLISDAAYHCICCNWHLYFSR